MYVNTVSRYLGDASAPRRRSRFGSGGPSPARLKELSASCAKQWAAFQKSHPKKFPHLWRAFLATNPICRAGIQIRWGYTPETSDPCGDANTGLLIDCWNQALEQGLQGPSLRGLGVPITQAQLNSASTAYQRLLHPGRLAGYRGLGQDDGLDLDPLDLNSVSTYSGVPYSPDILDSDSTGVLAPDIESNISEGTDIFGIPVDNSSSAAGYPNFPSNLNLPGSPTGAATATSILQTIASTVQAAIAGRPSVQVAGQGAQQQTQQAAGILPGVPNVILYAAGGLILLMIVANSGGGRRR
jgi:hypothetical protein